MPGSAVEKLAEKREKLERRLKAVREAEEAEKNKRLIVAGEAVLTEAATNAEFKRTLDEVLRRQVKGKRSRELFDLSEGSNAPGILGAQTA